MHGFLALILASLQAPPLEVPDGFEVEQAAAPPVVLHPLMACFDDRGRLYLAESAGLNLKADELLARRPNRVVRIEDADGDGVFDTRVVFADRMTMPMGVLWHDGAVFTASPPSLWRLEDTDGDGVADVRRELVTKFGFTGNAADIHGPFLGPDGLIYWTDGRHGHEIRRSDGTVMQGKAARIFRCRPDGSGVEAVLGGGMDNPVEVAFTPEGEMFFNANIVSERGTPRVDAIFHGVYGGAYPYGHPVVREFKRTGGLLPPMLPLGWVATSGLVRIRTSALGPEFAGNLFSTQFNRRAIRRHVLKREGSTFTATDEPFARSDHPHFHPTDILEAPDGSLLVVDTGGWFRKGCPFSKVAVPDFKGALYRIRRKGMKGGEPGAADPVEAVWRDPSKAPEFLGHAEARVRLAAAIAAGTLKLAGARERLEAMVRDVPPVRRAAATALGRIGDARSVDALFRALDGGADRFIEHAVTYALLEIGDAEAIRTGLARSDERAHRAALTALDQVGRLERGDVEPVLKAGHVGMVLPFLTARPEWADLLKGRLSDERGAPGVLAVLAGAPPGEHAWLADVVTLLRSANPEIVKGALTVIEASGSTAHDDALRAVVAGGDRPDDQRLVALRMLLVRHRELDGETFGWLMRLLGRATEPLDRLAVARCLGGAALKPDQRLALAGAMEGAGPLELRTLLGAFAGKGSAPEGRTLADSLARAPGAATLSTTDLERLFKNYPADVREAVRPLLERLAKEDARRRSRVDEMIGRLEGGDPERGRHLFFGSTVVCSSCHAVNRKGGRIGPDLGKIGSMRSSRDLVEAILLPSSSIARGYESYVIRLRDGRVVSGLLSGETPDALVLTTTERRVERIARKDIGAIRAGSMSIMPEGLVSKLSDGQLADLVAFLRSLK